MYPSEFSSGLANFWQLWLHDSLVRYVHCFRAAVTLLLNIRFRSGGIMFCGFWNSWLGIHFKINVLLQISSALFGLNVLRTNFCMHIFVLRKILYIKLQNDLIDSCSVKAIRLFNIYLKLEKDWKRSIPLIFTHCHAENKNKWAHFLKLCKFFFFKYISIFG